MHLMKPHPRIRLLLALAVAGTLLACGIGVVVQWPWLVAEHDRLTPLFRILIWFSDGAALLWVIWFGIYYCIFGRPLPSSCSPDPEVRYLVGSLLIAFTVDVAATQTSASDEEAGHARAVPTAGQIVGGRPTMNGEVAYVVCRFQDQLGVGHDSRLQISLADQPPPVRDAIQGGRFPVPVPITYDPEWPQRCWLVGFDDQENTRLHWMSASCLLFQALCMPMTLKYGVWTTAAGRIPLYKVIPLWADLTPFFLAAVAKFCIGEF
jgi:hypothetical protein